MSYTKLKKYNDYTDSNSHFFPTYPSHWELKRMQWIGNFSASGIDKKFVETESNCSMVNYTDVYGNQTAKIHSNMKLMKTTAPSQKITEHHLEKGDILFTPSSETADDIGVSAVAIEDMPEIVYSYHLTRFRPSILLDSDFSRFFCNSDPVLSQLSSFAQGTTRQILARHHFNTLNVVIPPEDERNIIGLYLDKKSELINTSIRLLENNLKLIKEKRSVLITQVVTKGLKDDCPMKDSGIESIGEIPNHWKVMKLRYLLSHIGSGKTPKGGSEVYQETGIPFIRSQNVHFTGLKLENVSYIDEKIDEKMSSSRVIGNDVLLNITGASLGRCCHVPSSFDGGNVNQHVCILRPIKTKILPEFLNQIMASTVLQSQISSLEDGSSREGLNFRQIADLVAVIPPTIEEQNDVKDYLNRQITIIDMVSQKTTHLIEKIREYQRALISEVVTGQIDVRSI
jgi:type I restriction enzyme, S subunit